MASGSPRSAGAVRRAWPSSTPAAPPALGPDEQAQLKAAVQAPPRAEAIDLADWNWKVVRTLLNQVPGWGATVVHDAAAACEVIRHVRIEVLVVDVNLPGISGLELLDLLRRDPTWDEPPVILMSANVDQPEIQAALRRGVAVTFIAKPFDVDELVWDVAAAVSGGSSAP